MTDPTTLQSSADLLQHLIRNKCVNDGSLDSGNESRSVETLRSFLEPTGIDIEVHEPSPGRGSLVARIQGSDPRAPSILLLGHTDVVPVNEDHWSHDPFGGELINGEIWGRGAVDMLHLTTSMAATIAQIARSGTRPRSTITFAAVADEEALGTWGADYLLKSYGSELSAHYVITETGGFPTDLGGGEILPVIVGEKGAHWVKLIVSGVAGHASQTLATDNALITAATVIDRLARHELKAEIHPIWNRFVTELGLDEGFTQALLDPDSVDQMASLLPIGMARQIHACTHTTIAPTMVTGGSKINTIPDKVEIQLDIRTLPGHAIADTTDLLNHIIGPDLSSKVQISVESADDSTASPIDTGLYEALGKITKQWYPQARVVPFLAVGATDARFFRRAGSTAYGFGLFSRNIGLHEFSAMFHGDDERVDLESLKLSSELFEALSYYDFIQ